MWCPECRQEVATELASDGRGTVCLSCGILLEDFVLDDLPDTRSARELLDRWAHEGLLDPPFDDPFLPEELSELELLRSNQRLPSEDRPETEEDAEAVPPHADRDSSSTDPSSRRRSKSFRVDAAHPLPHGSASKGQGPPPPVSRRRSAASSDRPARRHDAPHTAVPQPHFDLQAFVKASGTSPGTTESIWGQVLAYLGVGLLTVGTTLVLWGYFGGPVHYAPTGWLVTTAGQMLLFLGVVTLVSGGMQQTTHEVTQRVTYLGHQMLRIEQATQDMLRGPHFGQNRPTGQGTPASYQDDTGEFEIPGDLRK